MLLDLLNKALRRAGLLLVPKPSAKTLTEYANILEVQRGRYAVHVRWLRRVADWAHPGGDEYRDG